MSRPIPFVVTRRKSNYGDIKELVKNGKAIIRDLLSKNPHYGGRSGILIGPQGTGKTSTLIRLGEAYIDHGYITIWREIELAQFHRIEAAGIKVKVFAHEYDDVVVYAMREDSDEEEEYPVKIHKYRDVKDLYHKLEKRKMNVVIEPSYYIPGEDFIWDLATKKNLNPKRINDRGLPSGVWWVELHHFLYNRRDRKWIALLEDEYDDIAPAMPSGFLHTCLSFGTDLIKHSRKSLLMVNAATQSYSNIFWEIGEKFQDFYMKIGARPPSNPRYIIPKKYVTDAQWWMRVLGIKNEDELKGITVVQKGGLVGIIHTNKLPDVDYALSIVREWNGPTPSIHEVLEEYGVFQTAEAE